MAAVQEEWAGSNWGALVIELTLLAQLARLLCHYMRSCVSMCAVLRHRLFFLCLAWFGCFGLILKHALDLTLILI